MNNKPTYLSREGLAKLREGTLRAAPLPYDALEEFYGPEEMEIPIWIGFAFRAMQRIIRSHGEWAESPSCSSFT